MYVQCMYVQHNFHCCPYLFCHCAWHKSSSSLDAPQGCCLPMHNKYKQLANYGLVYFCWPVNNTETAITTAIGDVTNSQNCRLLDNGISGRSSFWAQWFRHPDHAYAADLYCAEKWVDRPNNRKSDRRWLGQTWFATPPRRSQLNVLFYTKFVCFCCLCSILGISPLVVCVWRWTSPAWWRNVNVLHIVHTSLFSEEWEACWNKRSLGKLCMINY